MMRHKKQDGRRRVARSRAKRHTVTLIHLATLHPGPPLVLTSNSLVRLPRSSCLLLCSRALRPTALHRHHHPLLFRVQDVCRRNNSRGYPAGVPALALHVLCSRLPTCARPHVLLPSMPACFLHLRICIACRSEWGPHRNLLRGARLKIDPFTASRAITYVPCLRSRCV
jgi:hypothetical protein